MKKRAEVTPIKKQCKKISTPKAVTLKNNNKFEKHLIKYISKKENKLLVSEMKEVITLLNLQI